MLRALVRAYVGGAWAVVLDVPLLFETGAEVVCGGVVVVGAGSVEVQMERLMGRDGLGEEDARRRVESQWGVDEKVRVAEYVFGERAWVVDNSQDLEYLRREVARVMEEVGKGRWGAWRWVWGAPPGVVVLALWVVLGNWWRRRRWEIEMRRVKAKL